MRHKLGDAFVDKDTTTNFKRVLKHGCTINEVPHAAIAFGYLLLPVACAGCPISIANANFPLLIATSCSFHLLPTFHFHRGQASAFTPVHFQRKRPARELCCSANDCITYSLLFVIDP